MAIGFKSNVRQIGSAKLVARERRARGEELPVGGAEIIPLAPLIKKSWGDRLRTQLAEVHRTLAVFEIPATPESTTLMLCFIHDSLERSDLPVSKEFRHCRAFVFSDYEKHIDLYAELCTRAVNFGIHMPVFERGLFKIQSEEPIESGVIEKTRKSRRSGKGKKVVSLDSYRKK